MICIKYNYNQITDFWPFNVSGDNHPSVPNIFVPFVVDFPPGTRALDIPKSEILTVMV